MTKGFILFLSYFQDMIYISEYDTNAHKDKEKSRESEVPVAENNCLEVRRTQYLERYEQGHHKLDIA